MDIWVVVAVLGAALLHALWNFLVRRATDKAVGMAAVMIGHLPLSVLALLWMGLPPIESAPYILLSALLHLGYSVFLLHAYRFGELSEIYPIARGASPILITLGSVTFLPDNLTVSEILGVLMISGAILTYGFAQIRNKSFNRMGIVLALATSCFISAYTIVDGTGTRIAQNAMIYFGMMSVCNNLFLVAYFHRFHRGVITRVFTEGWRICLVGGSASFIAYAIVLWACLSTPIALVSSLRETSVLFAVGLGTLFLGERLTLFKVILTAMIFCGVLVLRLS
jgi:drug/metabolite transporter (DMT)-like permease